MSKQVNERLTVSPFFLFFLIHSTQTGVGLLKFQSEIINGAGQDAWVSVILVGISFHLIIWILYFLLKKSKNGDIMSLHQQLFGKWAGKGLNILFFGYMLLIVVTVVRNYLAVLSTWVFPYTPIWILSLIMIIVISYIVTGGFRVLAGMCFWGMLIPSLLLLTMYFPIRYANWTNLLPLFNHNWSDYYTSAKNSVLIYSGPEFLLVYFPFIKDNQKSQKWAHLSQAYTVFLYLFITIVTFAYFSHGQLEHTIWPTLILSKIISFPFVERFEYIFIFTWLLVVLPPSCVALWGGIRTMKESFNWKPRVTLWLSIIIVYIAVVKVESKLEVAALGNIMTLVSTIFLYMYIPFLLIVFLLLQAFKKRRMSHN